MTAPPGHSGVPLTQGAGDRLKLLKIDLDGTVFEVSFFLLNLCYPEVISQVSLRSHPDVGPVWIARVLGDTQPSRPLASECCSLPCFPGGRRKKGVLLSPYIVEL